MQGGGGGGLQVYIVKGYYTRIKDLSLGGAGSKKKTLTKVRRISFQIVK